MSFSVFLCPESYFAATGVAPPPYSAATGVSPPLESSYFKASQARQFPFDNTNVADPMVESAAHIIVGPQEGGRPIYPAADLMELPDSSASITPLVGDIDGSGSLPMNIADLVYLVDWMFAGGPPPICPQSADCNGDSMADIADLVCWVEWMFPRQ